MEAYLRCMGVPHAAIQAQVAGEQVYKSRNVIALDEARFVVHKRTHINNFTESYDLDEERVTPTRYGARRSTVSLGDEGRLDGFAIATTVPTASGDVDMIEARQLIEGGAAHAQEIRLMNRSTDEQSVTRRVWTRVPVTDSDEEQLGGC
eukprot:jgi/Undpi1/5909/HiC_scaffold_2.g01183.m1